MNLKEITDFKERVDKARTRADELSGERAAIEKQLKKDFDCGSIGEAEKLEGKWETKVEKDTNESERLKDEFEEEYGDALE